MLEPKFNVQFLANAANYLDEIDKRAREKIYANIYKARYNTDPELLKKLRDDIWEFRTHYEGIQYRMLAFWDKTSPGNTLVIATHGFIKKQDKIPNKEIDRAIKIRQQYFENKF
ncbi:phage derived Gp49-like protein DUF891 [Chitinophaga niastensis]|uniref:Phage derived Gp49-like protein DUF891 n=1 Tax=Chitinophaga niastensis TaxID=536980 RepID=A0A2P8HT13_CHINA|nr:type II toxin-antitoxin system RelE/ParE family toxin [Chitinophaga niastensis]PSL49342.1 phage derived Gp49-like protein DUF891 [Chitinophaga niastensis]